MHLRFSLYLASILTGFGFAPGVRDIEQTGSSDALAIRTYRDPALGLQVEVNEDNGDVSISYWGDDFRQGYHYRFTIPSEVPEAVVATAIAGAMSEAVRDRRAAAAAL